MIMKNKFASIYLNEDNYMSIEIENTDCINKLDKLGEYGDKMLEEIIETITEEFNKIHFLADNIVED